MIITTSKTVSMGHRLPSYNGICSSPHGHNMTVTVQVEAASHFLDFKEVDRALGVIIDDWDHAMLLIDVDPLLPLLVEMGFRTVAFNVEPTTEHLAAYVFRHLSRVYEVLRVDVQETAKYGASCTSATLPEYCVTRKS